MLPGEDEDVSEALQRLLEDEGIELILNARAKRTSGKSGESVRIRLKQMAMARKKRWTAAICWRRSAVLRTPRGSDWS